jgi:Pyridoxamine 5'-phosphate oxidase
MRQRAHLVRNTVRRVKLSAAQALARVAAHDHGVLSTVHPERGVDAVPCVFAMIDGALGVPIDTVKPKAAAVLQRERNLAGDPRAALLVDHWDPRDWSQLWWVRVDLSWVASPADAQVDALASALCDRYPQYADRPFVRILVFRMGAVTGWSAESGPPSTL